MTESAPSNEALDALRTLTAFDTSPDGVDHDACVDWLFGRGSRRSGSRSRRTAATGGGRSSSRTGRRAASPDTSFSTGTTT
jgi:hypothetical protein